MSNWIPTAERLPDLDNKQVLVQWSDGNTSVVRSDYVDANQIIAWQELPAPYVPPKPKRFEAEIRGHVVNDSMEVRWHHNTRVRQVLPGDPDPDVVLEVLEEMKNYHSANPSAERWRDRIEESRSK